MEENDDFLEYERERELESEKNDENIEKISEEGNFFEDEIEEDELEDDIGDISEFENEDEKENIKDFEKNKKIKKKLPFYIALGGFLVMFTILAIPGIIKNSGKKNKNQSEFNQNVDTPVYNGENNEEDMQNKNLNIGDENEKIVNLDEPCDIQNLNNPNNINNPNCKNILNNQNFAQNQSNLQENSNTQSQNFENQNYSKGENISKNSKNNNFDEDSQFYYSRNISKPEKPKFSPKNIEKPSSGALNSLSKKNSSNVTTDNKNNQNEDKKIRPKVRANGINTFSLQQGSYIPIITSTQMNSDNPSYFMAIVSENVYSKDGKHKILIPMGSKIIGNYSALKNNNDTRMLMMVDKIILPNSKIIVFENSNVIDVKGEIGTKGNLNRKIAQRFGKSLLALTFSVADLVLDYRKTRVAQRYPRRWDEIITDPVNTVKDTMETLDKSWNSVKNRIKIPIGTKLNVFTGNEIILEEYRRS